MEYKKQFREGITQRGSLVIDTEAILAYRGPVYRMVVERGKIREFARATFTSHPKYFEDIVPVVPPTFLVSAGFFWGYTLETPRDSGIDRLGIDTSLLLQGEDEFVFHGTPPGAGTELWVESRFSDVKIRKGRRAKNMILYTLSSTFRDAEGRLVAEYRNTVIQILADGG